MMPSKRNVVLPKGFFAAGLWCGIKRSRKNDLGILVSGTPCVASALFTANRVQAAPLGVSREHLKKGRVQAVVVNSGNANCMTGEPGVRDARETCAALGKALGLRGDQVLVNSTGIIGRPLPMDKIKTGVAQAVGKLSTLGFSDFAHAVMTTDTFVKIATARLVIGGVPVTLTGCAKGAGMIAPRLRSATMLAFIATDAAVSRVVLERALAEATSASFNAITIDGCMSTNDTVMALANGQAGNPSLKPGSREGAAFAAALKALCVKLARLIVQDGEGATKFIAITVDGARNVSEAERLAFGVANSALFKCAMFGCDPNWGRIAAALGSVESGLSWPKLDIVLNGRPVFRKGRPVPVKNNAFLKQRDIEVRIGLNLGSASKTVYTTDLSYGYVRINADYN